jgi:hypothetical protein
LTIKEKLLWSSGRHEALEDKSLSISRRLDMPVRIAQALYFHNDTMLNSVFYSRRSSKNNIRRHDMLALPT